MKTLTLKEKLINAGIPESDISNHCSDLYVTKTPLSTEALKSYEFPQNITVFRSAIDGLPTYEIPFAYTEDYTKKVQVIAKPTTESRELALYAINNPGSHRQLVESTVISLQAKYRKGKFDKAKALTSMLRVATATAKVYCVDFGGTWNTMFSVTDRTLAAAEILEYYMEQITEVQG